MRSYDKRGATEGVYGRLTTDARSYQPLDIVTVSIAGRDTGDELCTITGFSAQRLVSIIGPYDNMLACQADL